jgi:hypothetical protein
MPCVHAAAVRTLGAQSDTGFCGRHATMHPVTSSTAIHPRGRCEPDGVFALVLLKMLERLVHESSGKRLVQRTLVLLDVLALLRAAGGGAGSEGPERAWARPSARRGGEGRVTWHSNMVSQGSMVMSRLVVCGFRSAGRTCHMITAQSTSYKASANDWRFRYCTTGVRTLKRARHAKKTDAGTPEIDLLSRTND